MKILGFLQNQWMRNPQRAREIMKRTPEARPRLLKYALFQCHTGHRLREVFGEEMEHWDWDNASPEIGEFSSARFPADHVHIRTVLERYEPDIVLAFGRVAERALRQIDGNFELLCGPHPAARGDDVMERLRTMKKMLDALKG